MAKAYVSIGSNIDPAENVREAVRRLSLKARITGISTVYHTEPEGRGGQPWFYNCVLELETEMPPVEFKQKVLRKIEEELGRKRGSDKYESRTIDLDLIAYDGMELTAEGLVLPDPKILKRPFLAIPLYEIAPLLKLPGGAAIGDVVEKMDSGTMKGLKEYSETLRKEIDKK